MKSILKILALLAFVGISINCNYADYELTKSQSLWPKTFWIGMPKAYFTAKDKGILLNAYAVRNQAFVGKISKPHPQEIIKRANEDDDFIVVVVSDKWHKYFHDRKEFVNELKNTENIKAYFLYIKHILINLNKVPKAVINFEPDPFGSFSKIIRKQYSGDPNNVPVPLSKVDFPEIKEVNPPDNFAGFWQVIDYMREKYAPNVMLAPTIKEWGIPVSILKDEPSDGWNKNAPGVIEMSAFYEKFGVNWDALAFNINDKIRPDEEFKTIVEYFTSVAKAMENKKTHRLVYAFIWKTMIKKEHFTKPVEQWSINELSFEFRNINFLASHGVRGMVIGYGNQLSGKYVDKNSLPPVLECWLKEYYNGKKQNCNPHGTIGTVGFE